MSQYIRNGRNGRLVSQQRLSGGHRDMVEDQIARQDAALGRRMIAEEQRDKRLRVKAMQLAARIEHAAERETGANRVGRVHSAPTIEEILGVSNLDERESVPCERRRVASWLRA